MKNEAPTDVSDLAIRLHDDIERSSPAASQEQSQHYDGHEQQRTAAGQQRTRGPEHCTPADTLPRPPLLSPDTAGETNQKQSCLTNNNNDDDENNEKHSNADYAICCDVDATQNTESDVSSTPKEASHCMGNRAHNAPPPHPSNDRPVGVPKAFRGLVPGGPLPGAYEVRRCRVQDGIPTWEQDDVDDDCDLEDVSNEELSAAAERIDSGSAPNVERNQFPHGLQQRCIVLVAASLLLLISTGIGVAFILTNEDRDPLKAVEISMPCDYQEMAQPDIQRQCLCDGQITILSQDTLARLDDIRAALGLVTPTGDGDADSIKACDPENMSLLLLATDNSISVSNNNILLNRYVLNVLYFSMNGDDWINNDGWLGTDDSCTSCCLYGVTCEGESVVAINLRGNGLAGSIPSELRLLGSLKALDLSENVKTVGQLPASLGQLTNLVSISFTANAITGTIPTNLGLLTDLEVLSLGLNFLSGSIPEELASLKRLLYFDIGQNRIEHNGPVPIWIRQTLSLKVLSLCFCSIDGSLPSQLALMTSLVILNLESNFLTGPIPSDIWRLTGLQTLILRSNSLVGTLPEAIANCSSLAQLILGDNKFTGPIPNNALGRLTHLKELVLGFNQMSGSIPASDDTGLCGLWKNGILKKLVVDCAVNSLSSFLPKVVCACCTECSII